MKYTWSFLKIKKEMAVSNNDNTLIKNTTYKVVIPFYLYASISFLLATILLFTSSAAFTQHYFQPHILASTGASIN